MTEGLLQILPGSPYLESSFFDFPNTEAMKRRIASGLRRAPHLPSDTFLKAESGIPALAISVLCL